MAQALHIGRTSACTHAATRWATLCQRDLAIAIRVTMRHKRVGRFEGL
jgi:hypothetical protein